MIKQLLFSGPELPLLQSLGALVLRLSFGGFMIAGHGWGKLMAFSDRADSFPDPLGIGNSASMGLAVLAEVVCAALVAVGFMTRVMVIPLIITMCVAFFIIHAADPFGQKELAAVYGIGYIAIALIGPGKFSVDRQLQ
jgi:putative oxidoreductase